MSKTIRMLMLTFAILTTQINISAMPTYDVKTAEYTLTVETKPITTVPVFCINGKYYAPLSCMAEFIGYHTEVDKSNANIINFVEGNSTNTEKIEQMLSKFKKKADRKVQESRDHVYVNGEKVEIDLLKVDGYNFIEVEQVANYVGYYLGIDNKKNVIDFTTDQFVGLSEEKQTLYSKYFTEHTLDIDVKQENKDLLTKSGLDKYPIVLVGEQHGIVKTYDIELYLIKCLNQNAGVKHIFMEEGYCDAQLINKYLKTGDNTILDSLMKNLKGTFAGNKEHSDFYKALYDYNKTLPEGKKLEVIGVDVQHQTDTGVNYLISILPKKAVPDTIKEKIDSLKASQKNNQYKYEELTALQKDIEDKKEVYEAYLGTEYEHFKLGIKGINQRLACEQEQGENKFMELRETMMIENFSTQYDKMGNEKCIGLFGGAHTYLDAEPDQYNMGTYLNAVNEQTKGKIGSISLEYYKCSYMDQYGKGSIPINFGKLQNMMAQAAKGDFALFPLCEEGSIFVKDGIAASQQYLLVVKDSPATELYNK